MTTLRMGVVGVGALGQHHARIVSELEGVELVAVADPREAVGRRIAEKCRCAWVPDHRDLLDAVDAVSVVTSTETHLDVASDFLRQGIPVLVEKPLALDVQQGKLLVRLAQNYGALLQVGHIERFNASLRAARAACGTPKYIRTERLSNFPFRSMDIGVVHDVMIHDIDLVLDLVQAPLDRVEAFGFGLMGAGSDSVQARLIFKNGAIADLTASRLAPQARRALQIWSEESCVTVDLSANEVVRYAVSEQLRFGGSPVSRAKQPGADVEQMKKEVFGGMIKVAPVPVIPCDALTAELEHFVECVRTGSTPLVDGAAGLRALTVAEQINAAVAAHAWSAPVELRRAG